MSDRLQIRLPSTNIFFRSGLVLDRYLSVVFEINGLVRLSLSAYSHDFDHRFSSALIA